MGHHGTTTTMGDYTVSTVGHPSQKPYILPLLSKRCSLYLDLYFVVMKGEKKNKKLY